MRERCFFVLRVFVGGAHPKEKGRKGEKKEGVAVPRKLTQWIFIDIEKHVVKVNKKLVCS